MTQSGGPQDYDTFKVEDAPNYVAGFDAVQNPGAWNEATKMMQLNNKQRVANAKIGERLIDRALGLAPTLAKAYKVKYDKVQDKTFNNSYSFWFNLTG